MPSGKYKRTLEMKTGKYKRTVEMNEANSVSKKGIPKSEKTKKNMRKPRSEEAKKNMQKPHKKYFENAKKNMWKPKSEEHKKNMRKPKSLEHCKAISDGQIKRYENLKEHEKTSVATKKALARPEVKLAISIVAAKSWKDPEIIAKHIKARHTFPNKPEKFLIELLEELFPKEWKYVGSGDLIIGRKNPDFVNEKQKKIIEFFGNFWQSFASQNEVSLSAQPVLAIFPFYYNSSRGLAK